MLKKLLSYLLPITIHEQKSEISKNLEITWNNGKLVLDTENTNYSYGSLQKVLRSGLQQIGKEKITKMNSILVLGVAGGSVIKTLINEFDSKAKTIGVEIDKEVIELANQYFELNTLKNYKTVLADASEFVAFTNEKFDLIIIDIFQDNYMPDFLYEKDFIENCKRILNDKGYILFNTMTFNSFENNRKYINHFDEKRYKINVFTKVEVFNELILIEKL